MSPEPELRRLVPADGGACHALMRAAARELPDAFTGGWGASGDPASAPWSAARLAPASGSAEVVIGAFAGSVLAGVVGLAFNVRPAFQHKATVSVLHVAPGRRGRGLGRRLVQAALEEAAHRPGLEVVAVSVNEGNVAAEALFARCGFVPYGREPLAACGESGHVTLLHLHCGVRGNDVLGVHAEPASPLDGPFPVLQTRRLRLRELTRDDAPALYAIHADREAMKWFGSDPLTELAEAHYRIQLFLNMRTEPRPGLRWAVTHRTTGQLLGSCGLFHWDRSLQTCSVGYELGRSAWGQGFMREAVAQVLDWGFCALSLCRVEARIHPDNAPSRRLVEHLGFVREGRLRQSLRWSGRWHDLELYGLLQAEHAGRTAPATTPVP